MIHFTEPTPHCSMSSNGHNNCWLQCYVYFFSSIIYGPSCNSLLQINGFSLLRDVYTDIKCGEPSKAHPCYGMHEPQAKNSSLEYHFTIDTVYLLPIFYLLPLTPTTPNFIALIPLLIIASVSRSLHLLFLLPTLLFPQKSVIRSLKIFAQMSPSQEDLSPSNPTPTHVFSLQHFPPPNMWHSLHIYEFITSACITMWTPRRQRFLSILFIVQSPAPMKVLGNTIHIFLNELRGNKGIKKRRSTRVDIGAWKYPGSYAGFRAACFTILLHKLQRYVHICNMHITCS